jgi:hypothetical protein
MHPDGDLLTKYPRVGGQFPSLDRKRLICLVVTIRAVFQCAIAGLPARGVARPVGRLRGQDRDRSIFWFRNMPIPEFGHRTAETLVAEGKIEEVIAHLESIAAGSSG